MTESLKLSASAVNKFLYYSQNWKQDSFEIDGIMTSMPDFFKVFEGSGMLKHFWEEWRFAYAQYGSRAVLAMFYFTLDDCWRIAVIEYILTNYNCEIKLHFNKEDE